MKLQFAITALTALATATPAPQARDPFLAGLDNAGANAEQTCPSYNGCSIERRFEDLKEEISSLRKAVSSSRMGKRQFFAGFDNLPDEFTDEDVTCTTTCDLDGRLKRVENQISGARLKGRSSSLGKRQDSEDGDLRENESDGRCPDLDSCTINDRLNRLETQVNAGQQAGSASSLEKRILPFGIPVGGGSCPSVNGCRLQEALNRLSDRIQALEG